MPQVDEAMSVLKLNERRAKAVPYKKLMEEDMTEPRDERSERTRVASDTATALCLYSRGDNCLADTANSCKYDWGRDRSNLGVIMRTASQNSAAR